jgi:hypothetical protein
MGVVTHPVIVSVCIEHVVTTQYILRKITHDAGTIITLILTPVANATQARIIFIAEVDIKKKRVK